MVFLRVWRSSQAKEQQSSIDPKKIIQDFQGHVTRNIVAARLMFMLKKCSEGLQKPSEIASVTFGFTEDTQKAVWGWYYSFQFAPLLLLFRAYLE